MSNEQAKKAAAMQRGAVAANKQKHEQEVSKLKDELKEDAARGIFSMGLTEKQMRGLRVSTYLGGLNLPKSKKPKLKSSCCNADAYEYRAVHVSGKPPERYYRCRKCYGDCEVRERKNSAS